MPLRSLALVALLVAGCTASGTVSASSPAPGSPSAMPSTITTDAAVTLPSGVKYTILEPAPAGAAQVHTGQKLTVDYTGWLVNGTKFDSSIGKKPFSFTLGSGVIQGWSLGVAGMGVGEKRKLVIPAELGYGAAGAGASIPPNSMLVFEVKLISIDS